MLFDAIGTQSRITKDQAIAKFWGSEIESVPHPQYRYGCDVYPHGWTEITQEEFSQSNFFRYAPLATAWSRTLAGDARMFFMHNDSGFALIGNYWDRKISIFKFGCEHQFKSKEVGRCLTKYTCEKCGFVETIDSSD